MKRLLQQWVRNYVLKTGKLRWLYVRFCRPTSTEYADFLRRHGGLRAIGANCSILPSTNFADPSLTRVGNNVHFSNCAIFGHDGSIAMLNKAYNVQLDAVGKVDIRDNVFIGFGAIVLPNVTIGPNAIVAAGAVVTRDVPPNSVVAGVPAKVIGKLDELVARMQAKTKSLPWADLLRTTHTDPADASAKSALHSRRIECLFEESAPEPTASTATSSA